MSHVYFDGELLNSFVGDVLDDEFSALVYSAGTTAQRRRIPSEYPASIPESQVPVRESPAPIRKNPMPACESPAPMRQDAMPMHESAVLVRECRRRRVRDGPERRVPKPERAQVVIPEPCSAEIDYVDDPEDPTADYIYGTTYIEGATEPPRRRSSFREAMIREGVLRPIPGCTMLINPLLYDEYMRRRQVEAIMAQPSAAQLMLEDLRNNGLNSERFKGFKKIPK